MIAADPPSHRDRTACCCSRQDSKPLASLSERLLQESLSELRPDMLLVVVAHRPATLELCDRVMVVVDGRIEAFDAPSVLASSQPYYAQAAALPGSSEASTS